jgi:hypothetical protein
MNEFEFYIDRKTTIWVREHHIVEANTLDEAKGEMIKQFHDNMCVDTFDVQETLYDTEECMEPGDNNGYPTSELYFDGELLTDNLENLKTNI